LIVKKRLVANRSDLKLPSLHLITNKYLLKIGRYELKFLSVTLDIYAFYVFADEDDHQKPVSIILGNNAIKRNGPEFVDIGTSFSAVHSTSSSQSSLFLPFPPPLLMLNFQ